MSSNTEIIPPGREKFTLPEIPEFKGKAPWLSVLSLLGFFFAAATAFMFTGGLPLWSRAPFVFSAIGSGIGFVYELWLITSGRAYQLYVTPGGRIVQWQRALVLVCVYGSTYLAYCLLTFGDSSNTYWIVGVSGLLTGSLAVMVLLRGPMLLGAAVFLLGFLSQLALVWFSPEISALAQIPWLLTAAAATLYLSIVVGAETPQRSTVFHVLGIASVGALYYALQRIGQNAEATFVGSPPRWTWLCLLLGFFAAAFAAFYALPRTWGVLRAFLANASWPFFYLLIAGGLRAPRPDRLGVLYRGKEDQLQLLKLLPYDKAHPRNLTHPISVPCLDEALTLKVHAFGFITRMVTFFFGVASVANRWFPFANIRTPLSHKPRMEVWSDGSQYWPWWLLKRVWLPGLGWFQIQSGVRGPGFQPTPEDAVDAYHNGQLLAYLVEFGIAGSFIAPDQREGKSRLKLDLSFLEAYEPKPDYESYGGVAYLEIDEQRKRLVLTSVRAPGATQEIPANPLDAAFRHAEDLILASVYFYVVSGKHLCEIHMGLNLVEVALFNAFDAQRRWNHPVRMALYPHLFAHELAEELTTQNLLEDGAVFPQIFATTNSALMRHLNDRFSEYQLGRDEDFEHRQNVLLSGRPDGKLSDVLPRCSLVWELEYAAIWREYAAAVVDAAYAGDEEVANDACIQSLFGNLSHMFHQPLPSRYNNLATKAGLVTFLADTMHHLIIRHEVYGTTGVRLSLDPRINKVQVAKDGGPPALDEWRSLACVAMATSRVRYTSLMINFANVFSDIDDQNLQRAFRLAHTQLKSRLQQLETKFKSDGVDNYQTLRPLPSELDIGAGY